MIEGDREHGESGKCQSGLHVGMERTLSLGRDWC